MATAGMRLNLYLPARMARWWDDAGESRSARGVQMIDRLSEALRRTAIAERFSAEEAAALREGCSGWVAEPAAVVFGGVALELRSRGLGTPALFSKLEQLTPLEEVALVEWLEGVERHAANVMRQLTIARELDGSLVANASE